MFCFDDKGIDGRDESLPGRDGGPRNGRAESARVHGSHDGAHRPHAQKRHHAQNRGGQRGGVKSGSFPEVPLPEPKNSSLPLKQGAAPSELPPWMKFLHGKLANPSTPLNIRLFVSKLVINAEEVTPPPPHPRLGRAEISSRRGSRSNVPDFRRCSGRTPNTSWGPSCSSSCPGTTAETGSTSWWWTWWSRCSRGSAWRPRRFSRTHQIHTHTTTCEKCRSLVRFVLR